jgi:hypothetical protein
MLVHHDARDYAVASKEAAEHARGVIEGLLTRGQASAATMLKKIDEEQPIDRYISSSNLFFKPDGEKALINQVPLHAHALVQVAEKAGVPSPVKTCQFLSDPRFMPHFCNILNEAYGAHNNVYLTRSVKDEIRGFLSNKFRRLDSRPVVGALVEEAVKYGAVPIEARVLDTRVALKMLLPRIYEPVTGEVMAFGLCFQNSDFGDGALTLKGFMYRLWCTNLAMCEDAFRQIHLGRKIGGMDIALSNKTYELDTETTVSLVKDVTAAVLSPACIEAKLEKVKEAATKEIDATAAIKGMRDGSKLTKDEAAKVAEAYNSAEIRKLPAGQTAWRLSNAISLFAQSCEVARSLELEDLAGKVAGLQ